VFSLRAVVISDTLNQVGGAERVGGAVIDLLNNRMGFKVSLYTVEKLRNGRITSQNLTSHNLPFLGRLGMRFLPAKTFFLSAVEFLAGLNSKASLVVNTVGMSSTCLLGDLIYVHFPNHYYWARPDTRRKAYSYGNTLRKTYSYGNGVIWNALSQLIRSRADLPRFVVANSVYTLNAIKSVIASSEMRRRTFFEVIYPPVESKKIVESVSPFAKRYDVVVTVSRISPEKNLVLIPQIAEQLPFVTFVIIGRVQDYSYYRVLRRLIEESHAENVRLYTDLDDASKFDILTTSKVYLHTTPGEHFGISIVEGMASGLIPIVHDSGGQREIVPQENRYKTAEEAAEKIRIAVSGWTREISDEYVKSALKFDLQEFQGKMAAVIRSLAACAN